VLLRSQHNIFGSIGGLAGASATIQVDFRTADGKPLPYATVKGKGPEPEKHPLYTSHDTVMGDVRMCSNDSGSALCSVLPYSGITCIGLCWRRTPPALWLLEHIWPSPLRYYRWRELSAASPTHLHARPQQPRAYLLLCCGAL